MKVYSILLFLVFLNLVMGFTFTMIDTGVFLPEAQGVLKNPATDNVTNELNRLTTSVQSFVDNPNVLTFLDGCWTFITTCGQLFFAVVSTPATLISQILPVPDALVQIVTMGMTVITVFTLVQLLTGRWFSFVE